MAEHEDLPERAWNAGAVRYGSSTRGGWALFCRKRLTGIAAAVLMGAAGEASAQTRPAPPGVGVSPPLLRPPDLAPPEPLPASPDLLPSIPVPAPAPAVPAPVAPPVPVATPTPPNDPPPPLPAPAALPAAPAPLGMTPAPTALAREKIGQYVDKLVDPEATLDLVVGRTRLLVLKDTPKRIQVAQEHAVDFNLITGTDLLLEGKQVGDTSLTLWFPDPNDKERAVTLTYLVRVSPDPEEKDRLDRVCKALEADVNRFFPQSHVELSMLGDKLAASGVVKDAAEGTQILRILHANAPGKPAAPNADGPPTTPEDFMTAGGPNVVNLLRVPGEQQVMLHVVVAEMDRSAARSIGLNFNVTDANGVTVFGNHTGPIVTADLSGERVPLAVNALRELHYAKSMAEPTLVTLNGQTADFQADGQFPVPIVSGCTAGGLQGVQFVPYGVQLRFTPCITDRDCIRLAVSANVSSRDVCTGTNIGGADVPGLTTRNFDTTVELREGETLAVAGLIQANQGAESARLPFAGLLPVVGPLTGLTQQTAGEQELVILVTPELAHPLPPGSCPPLPGADLFEPNDVEFYLLGRIESHCPRDYRSPIRTDASRVMQYRHVEDAYISGPTGYAPEP